MRQYPPIPEWKKCHPFPRTDWGAARYDEPGPYPSTDFTVPPDLPPERFW